MIFLIEFKEFVGFMGFLILNKDGLFLLVLVYIGFVDIGFDIFIEFVSLDFFVGL